MGIVVSKIKSTKIGNGVADRGYRVVTRLQTRIAFDPSDKPRDVKIFTEMRSKDQYQVEIFGM